MQVSVKHLELLRPKTRPIASLIDDVAAGETVNVSASSTTTNHTAVSESESQLHMPTEPAVTLGTLDAEGHLLVSTGYWQIGHSKRGDREQGRHVYERCMPPVMSLNAPMALYGDAAGLEAMRAARQNSGGPLSAAASKEVDVQQLGPCGEAPEALASRGFWHALPGTIQALLGMRGLTSAWAMAKCLSSTAQGPGHRPQH